MAYRIKNTSPGPRGIHTVDRGLVFIPAGEERTLDPADMASVRRKPFYEITEIDAQVPAPPKELTAAVDKFDQDGDGKPGGSKKGAESTAAKGAARKRRRKARAKSAKAKP